MEIEKKKKNHWTQNRVDEANKKINQEIYKRNRQAPIQIKMDDMSIYINDKITRRGISRGLVFIQENLNKNILKAEKYVIEILITEDIKEQCNLLIKTKAHMKVEIWPSIRFLMVNKAITPGEITELIRMQMDIDNDLDKWLSSLQKAISAKR